jgi:hypothetical protein
VPQVLLPVIPHLTSELHSEDGAKRQEAATLLGRLLSLPGNKLVNEYRDVLDALLRRYCDVQVRTAAILLGLLALVVMIQLRCKHTAVCLHLRKHTTACLQRRRIQSGQ